MPDPWLTEEGVRQAEAAAARLAGTKVAAVVASPYKRCVQTAQAIATRVGAQLRVDPLVRERCAFSCDQGSPPAELARIWPDFAFGHLPEMWWGTVVESQPSIALRARRFREEALGWPDEAQTVVVSHWGFVRALTGLEVGNSVFVRYDPASGTARVEPAEPAAAS